MKRKKKPHRICVFSPEEVTTLIGAIEFLKEQVARSSRDEPDTQYYVNILTRVEAELKLSDRISNLGQITKRID